MGTASARRRCPLGERNLRDDRLRSRRAGIGRICPSRRRRTLYRLGSDCEEAPRARLRRTGDTQMPRGREERDRPRTDGADLADDVGIVGDVARQGSAAWVG